MTSEFLFVGTHRKAHHADPEDIALGIYVLGGEQGGFQLSSLTQTPQPGWIALHPDRRVLYTVNEVKQLDGRDGGAVSAFAIDGATGGLRLIGQAPLPPMPCHCEVDATGRYLVVATFGGGSVHLFPLDADGGLGPEADVHRHEGSSVHPRRQTAPHAHAASIDPSNAFVLVPDLGADRLVVYRLDHDAAKLRPLPDRSIALPPGSGPRHIAFGLDGRFAYLINEMSATVTVLTWPGHDGGPQILQSVDLLPADFEGLRSGAAIAVHPSGRFLYATTRSHGSSGRPPQPGLDTVVWFDISPTDGRLSLQGRIHSGGGIPRSFDFDDCGDRLFVAHQCNGVIVTFDIDRETGTPTASPQIIETPVPVCIRYLGVRA